MLVERQQVIEWLAETGDIANAFEVEAALPLRIDTDQDRELLEKYGVDVDDLVERHQR